LWPVDSDGKKLTQLKVAMLNRQEATVFVQMDNMTKETVLRYTPAEIAAMPENDRESAKKLTDIKGISVDRNISNLIPFGMEKTGPKLQAGNSKYQRYQYPLSPAASVTGHKMQGITATEGVVAVLEELKRNKNGHWTNGMPFALAYTIYSRVTSWRLLTLTRPMHVCDFVSDEFKVYYDAIDIELKRLKELVSPFDY